MGLDQAFEPELTQRVCSLYTSSLLGQELMQVAENRLVPFSNHGAPCMSMGFLLPASANSDQPIVWRGMMVMKGMYLHDLYIQR